MTQNSINNVSPGKPLFFAYLSSPQADQTGDGTLYAVPFDTEIFDVTSNFSSGTFTAPIDGKYYFYSQVLAQEVTATMTAEIRMTIGGVVYTNGNWGTSIAGNMPQTITTIAQMTAAQTATVSVNFGGGAKVVDIFGNATGPRTYFTGYLVS